MSITSGRARPVAAFRRDSAPSRTWICKSGTSPKALAAHLGVASSTLSGRNRAPGGTRTISSHAALADKNASVNCASPVLAQEAMAATSVLDQAASPHLWPGSIAANARSLRKAWAFSLRPSGPATEEKVMRILLIAVTALLVIVALGLGDRCDASGESTERPGRSRSIGHRGKSMRLRAILDRRQVGGATSSRSNGQIPANGLGALPRSFERRKRHLRSRGRRPW